VEKSENPKTPAEAAMMIIQLLGRLVDVIERLEEFMKCDEERG
jgi:hypothetical protein